MLPTSINYNKFKVFVDYCHEQGNREYQEDSLAFSKTGQQGFVCAVADGMGGIAGGKEISEFVAKQFIKRVKKATPKTLVYSELCQIVNEIKQVIIKDGMQGGTTLCALYATDDGIYWCCVGDSRAYLMRDHKLIQLNEDGDYLNQLLEMVIDNQLDIKKAYENPQKGSLACYLGQQGRLKIDGNDKPLQVKEKDRIILCSDGIYKFMNENQLVEILESPAPSIRNLLIDQNQNNGKRNQDNYTAFVISFD